MQRGNRDAKIPNLERVETKRGVVDTEERDKK